MNGITIIEEHFCRQVSLQELIVLGCLITLLCVGALFVYWFVWKNSVKTKGLKICILTCSMLIVVTCIASWCFQINAYNTTHMEYTVTIDDTVGFNEFHEKYEIVSENDDEYRIKER